MCVCVCVCVSVCVCVCVCVSTLACVFSPHERSLQQIPHQKGDTPQRFGEEELVHCGE